MACIYLSVVDKYLQAISILDKFKNVINECPTAFLNHLQKDCSTMFVLFDISFTVSFLSKPSRMKVVIVLSYPEV